MSRAVSIKQIALDTGVSYQTVSKVLNGKGTVSAETRQRIMQAADRLHYIPNSLARSLVTQSTCTLGVVAGDFSDYVLTQFVVGAEREARRHGHSVIIGNIDRTASDAEHYVRVLLERRVDGILLAAPQLEQQQGLSRLLSTVPVVALHPLESAAISTVALDHVQTGYLPTRHLLALGHRRVATITGPWDRPVTHHRLRGYRQALEEAGIAYDKALVVPSDWQVDGGYRAARELLARAPTITAIAVQNDTMALGVLSALHQLGRQVPNDCAVVGCDDIPPAAYAIPPLTTVHTPLYETGEAAIHVLLDRIANNDAAPQHILQPVSLIHRVSCGGAKAKA